MGIIQRFKEIMSANINTTLDKMEDPAKMVDQLLRDLNEQLGAVKAETAGVMAEEQRARRSYEECNSEIEKLLSYAQRAVDAGNDDDAKQFLIKKNELEATKEILKRDYENAAENSIKMRQMHDKLVEQISELNTKRVEIKAKMQLANTQSKINNFSGTADKFNASMDSFNRMEEKANKALDTANAMYELNNKKDDISDLMRKYDSSAKRATSNVEEELEMLRRKN